MMENVKMHHRNLEVTFYDYKKTYQKVHHDISFKDHNFDWKNDWTELKVDQSYQG